MARPVQRAAGMTRRHAIFFSSCLLALSACGGGGGSEPEDAGTELDSSLPDGSAPDAFTPDMGVELEPATYRAAFIEMLCRSYFECLNRHTASLQDYVGGFTSVEECTSSDRMLLLTRTFMPWPESIADGHVAFDPERAAACLEARATTFCDETATEPRIDDPCEDVWEGLRESGESCRKDECVHGTSCTTGSGCHGTCNPVMFACPECAADEWCDAAAGTCEALLAEGETCGASFQCQEGLVCDAPSMGTGDCVATGIRAEGEACEVDDVCEEGLYCEGSTCRPYFLEPEGDACGMDGHICEPELICFETSLECETPHAVGDPCVNNIGDCGADLYCDFATNLCAEQKANGTACTEGFECLSYYCPSATNECATPPICEIP